MLIQANRNDYPDHPTSGSGTGVHNPRCPYSWWFRCWHRTGSGTARIQCARMWRVDCARGRHIPLEMAIAALQQAGWRLAALEEGGGWRCPAHAGDGGGPPPSAPSD